MLNVLKFITLFSSHIHAQHPLLYMKTFCSATTTKKNLFENSYKHFHSIFNQRETTLSKKL